MALRRTPRGMVNTGTRIRPLIPKITKRLRRQQYGQGGGAVVAGYVWCIDNDGTNYGYAIGDYGSITPDTTRASGTGIDYVYVSDTDTMHVGFELGAYLPGISTFIIDLPNGMSFPIYWDMVNHEYNGFETGLTVYAQSLQGTCINIKITHLDHVAVMWMAAFNNTLGEMQTQLIGQGTPETDHSMPMLAPDHEGVYREFDVDEPVWAYGRVAENLTLYSEEFASSYWSVDGQGTGDTAIKTPNYGVAPDGTQTACRLQLNLNGGTSTNDISILRGGVPGHSGEEGIRSWWIRKIGGTGDRVIFANSYVDAVTVSTEWQRLSSANSLTHAQIEVGLRGTWGSDNIDILIWHPMCESASGRTNLTSPSEYITTTAAPVQKVFNYANGNTVDGNGVVTEARGDYLIPQPYLVAQDEGTNDLTYSNVYDSGDVLRWTGTGVNASTAIQQAYGLGDAPSAVLFDDDGSTNYLPPASIVSVSGSLVTSVWYIEKDTDETRFPELSLRCYGGTTIYASYMSVNTRTGESQERTSEGAPPVNIFEAELKIVGDKEYWAFYQTITLGDNTSASYNTRPAMGASLGSYDTNTVGSCVFAYGGVFVDLTIEEVKSLGPIITDGAAETTGPLKPQFDAANHDNNDGAYYTNVDNTGDDVVLMSDGLYDFLKIESGNVILDDGTNQLQLPIPGPNHVLNGKFIGNLNHWNTSGTDGGNTVTWSNGRAFMSTTSLQTSFMQTGLLNIGTDYVLDVDIEIVAGDVNFLSDGTDIALVDGHNTVPFTASMDGVLFRRGATNITQVYFDNVVVREATPTEQARFFSVGAVYEGDVAGINQMNLNVDGVWANGLGTDEVINGDFDTDTDWVTSNGWSIAGGEAICDGTNGYSLSQEGNYVDGVSYLVVFDLTSAAGGVRISIGNGTLTSAITTSGRHEITIVAGSYSTLGLRFYSSNFNGSIDNVSAKEVFGNGAEGTPYDGSLGTGDIVLGETQHAVTRYQGGTYQEKKDKIDERMP